MNYIGSKITLLDFIQTAIKETTSLSSGVFADLFAGTGVVGAAYRQNGFNVISNDLQTYSYVLCKHRIENDGDVLYGDVGGAPYLKLLNYVRQLGGFSGFIYNNYCMGSGSGRNYFSDHNGRICDAIRMELEALHVSGKIDDRLYYYFLASLIDSIDRYANTASVYISFLKHIKKSAGKEFRFELLPCVPGPRGKVYQKDANDLVRDISGDILYLDPPYNTRQYCAYYHVLETIARYDNPTVHGVTGIRDYSDQKSVYCSKKTVADAFEDLVANANFSYIFLSYNSDGLMSFDTIGSIMSKYGVYRYYQKEYPRYKGDRDSNRTFASHTVTEYLHCLAK